MNLTISSIDHMDSPDLALLLLFAAAGYVILFVIELIKPIWPTTKELPTKLNPDAKTLDAESRAPPEPPPNDAQK